MRRASVRLNTGASLTFHIPAGDKGRVEVCLLLRDGGCHGNASLTYLSAPVCASIAPDSTWARLGYNTYTNTHIEDHSVCLYIFFTVVQKCTVVLFAA